MKNTPPSKLSSYGKNLLLSALAGLTFLFAGCSINMQHTALLAPPTTRSGTVNLEAAAKGTTSCPEGAGGRVGWGRITLFGIPCVPIHVDGDGNAALALQIQDALAAAGYQPQLIDPGSTASGKVLNCEVEKFRFSNYTYFFPIVPTWGGVDLKLHLVGADHTVLWTHDYQGGGSTLNFFNGYTSSCKSAMTQVLNKMTRDFAGDEFYKALNY